MNIRRLCYVALLATILLAAFLTPAAEAQETADVRTYNPRFISADDVAAFVYQVCADETDCNVRSMSENGLMVRATLTIHQQLAAFMNERDAPRPTQQFRVILLQASSDGATPDLPGDAAAALADLASVLPYSGFLTIDSGWLRTSGRGSTKLGEAGSFEVELHFQGDTRQDARLLVDSFVMYYRPVYWENGGSDSPEEPFAVLGDPEQIISSQFGIIVGETVVVGTSRVNGNSEALVVLLTALDR